MFEDPFPRAWFADPSEALLLFNVEEILRRERVTPLNKPPGEILHEKAPHQILTYTEICDDRMEK